ncbi:MAG TPA: Yip1 family protein [Caulobacteraceae bacterium]|nr:Yip1 family protein [Caulobacteraceae bacterium]
MSVVEGGPSATNIVQRVQNILLKPATEWDVIEQEPATTQSLFLGYACIVAVIPAVGALLGRLLFFHSIMGLVGGVVMAAVTYGLTLGVTFVGGIIINALAASFDAKSDSSQAMKVAVYSATAGWVAGIVSWIPVLGWLIAWAALAYGCYLLYLGISKVMKPPAEKAVGYAVVVIVIEIVLSAIVFWIVAMFAAMAVFGAAMTGAAALTSSAPVHPHGGIFGLAAAANQAAASAKAVEEGKAPPAVDPEKLKAMLPDSVAGLPRTELSASSMGNSGVGASNAEAVYERDNNRITLTVTDLAAAQGLAAFAGAMNVNSSKETATGYEKVSTVNGRMTTEEWDRESKNGKYGIVVAGRFSVEASGTANSIDDLKAAVAAVGPDRLEGMAHS